MANQAKDATNEEIQMEEYPVLPAGMYRCSLKGVTSEELQFGPTFRFKWSVIEGEYVGEELTGFANKKLVTRSKLALWAKAHLNISAFPEDYTLKIGSLIGQKVFVTIGVEPRKDGSGDINVIRAVDPIATARKATKTPKATPANGGFNSMLSDDEEIPDPGEPIKKGERKVED